MKTHSYFSKQFLERFTVNTGSKTNKDVHHRPLYSAQLARPSRQLNQIFPGLLALTPCPLPHFSFKFPLHLFAPLAVQHFWWRRQYFCTISILLLHITQNAIYFYKCLLKFSPFLYTCRQLYICSVCVGRRRKARGASETAKGQKGNNNNCDAKHRNLWSFGEFYAFSALERRIKCLHVDLTSWSMHSSQLTVPRLLENPQRFPPFPLFRPT